MNAMEIDAINKMIYCLSCGHIHFPWVSCPLGPVCGYDGCCVDYGDDDPLVTAYDPCDLGTVGCSADHSEGADVECATW